IEAIQQDPRYFTHRRGRPEVTRWGSQQVDRIRSQQIVEEWRAANPVAAAATKDPYMARELSAGGLTAQFLQPRGRVVGRGLRQGVKWIDDASVALDRSELVHRLPGIRHVTSSERVAKAAGRAQRQG